MASSFFTEEEDRLLTQTGPGTTMGDFMRRYWFPALLSNRLPAANSDPVPITLLGEELVAFRSADGRVGLVDRYCPHRRASLALARTGECGIRCIYHGWLIDPDGRVLETPPEPANSRFAQTVQHRAYPTREAAGVVWTYMGPPEARPPFPNWLATTLPESHVLPLLYYQPCNWLQSFEGDFDAGHAPYLHWSKQDAEFALNLKWQDQKIFFDPRPLTAFAVAPWGVQSVMRFVLEYQTEAVYWVNAYVMPFFSMLPVLDGYLFRALVPSNDESHYAFTLFLSPARPLADDFYLTLGIRPEDFEVDPTTYYSPEWTGEGYRQDRELMRSGESWSGIAGGMNQDMAVTQSMGGVVDRTKENLAGEDFLVIQTRKYYLETLDKFRRGEVLPGLQEDMDHSAVDCRSVVTAVDTPLHEVLRRTDWRYRYVPGDSDVAEKPPATIWTPPLGSGQGVP